MHKRSSFLLKSLLSFIGLFLPRTASDFGDKVSNPTLRNRDQSRKQGFCLPSILYHYFANDQIDWHGNSFLAKRVRGRSWLGYPGDELISTVWQSPQGTSRSRTMSALTPVLKLRGGSQEIKSWDQAMRMPPVTCPRGTQRPFQADWSVRALCNIQLETWRMGAHPQPQVRTQQVGTPSPRRAGSSGSPAERLTAAVKSCSLHPGAPWAALHPVSHGTRHSQGLE